MPDNTPTLYPYCSVAWADAYLKANLWSDAWTSAPQEKQLAALNTASGIIHKFAEFYDEYGNQIEYPLDQEQLDLPNALKEATAIEAKYLLTLEDSILEPNSNLTMGIKSANGVVFDKGFQGDIVIAPVRSLIVRMGGIVNQPDNGDTAGNIVAGRYVR